MRMRGLRQDPGSPNPCIFSTVVCHLLPQTLGGPTSATAVVQLVHLRLETWYLKGYHGTDMGPLPGSPVQCGNSESRGREEVGRSHRQPRIPVWHSSVMCGSRLIFVDIRAFSDSSVRPLPQKQ